MMLLVLASLKVKLLKRIASLTF